MGINAFFKLGTKVFSGGKIGKSITNFVKSRATSIFAQKTQLGKFDPKSIDIVLGINKPVKSAKESALIFEKAGLFQPVKSVK